METASLPAHDLHTRFRAASAPTSARELARDRWIVGALTVALAISLAYAFFVSNIFNQDDYMRWAVHLLNWWKGVMPEPVLRTPGYEVFLAVDLKLSFGHPGIKVAQCLLVTATGYMVAYLAELVGGRRAARWTAGVFAIYVPFLFFAAVALSEVLSTFLMMLSVVAVIRARRHTDAWATWVGVASACAIAGVSVRPAQVFLLPVVVVALLATAGSLRRAVGVVAILVIAALVIFGPWVGRNMALYGQPRILGSGGTYPFALGVHLPADKRIGQYSAYHRAIDFYDYTRPDHFGPLQASQMHALPTLIHNLVHHTGQMLWARVVAQFQMYPWPATPRVDYNSPEVIPYPLIMALHIIVFALGILGLVWARRTMIGRMGLGVLALTVLPYLILLASPRYTIPISPFMVMGAGIALTRISASPRVNRWVLRLTPSRLPLVGRAG